MGYGLETFTDDGRPQLAENSVYVLHSKGRTTVGAGLRVPEGAMVFVANMTHPVYVATPLTGGHAKAYSPGGAGAQFDYYVFIPSSRPGSDNVGLQSFDPNGKLVFDSSIPAMRIVGGDITTWGDPPRNVYAGSGSGKYAACLLSGVDMEKTGGGQGGMALYHLYAWCVSLSGRHVQTTRHFLGNGPLVDDTQDVSYVHQGGTVLIIDVGGL